MADGESEFLCNINRLRKPAFLFQFLNFSTDFKDFRFRLICAEPFPLGVFCSSK